MPVAGPAATPERHVAWRRRATVMLGTLVEISLLCDSDTSFGRLSRIAFSRIADYQRAMSFHERSSDVHAIALAHAGSTLSVRPETSAVIAAALALEHETAGVFNVAVGAQLVARGRLPAPSSDVRWPRLATSARAALRLDPGDRLTIVEPVWIDLGGIAKGAAVDAALGALREAGAQAAIVNAGGDIALYGAASQPITVVGPGGLHVAAGQLADGAIATSGPFGFDDGIGTGTSNLVLHAGRSEARWAHRSVSVVAPDCLHADALTKVVAVLGPDASAVLARHAARAFTIDASGRLMQVG